MVDWIVDPYKSGSGAERRFFAQYFKGGQKIQDHDNDPKNWTEVDVTQSNTAINSKAAPGDQEAAAPSIDPKVEVADELEMKKYKGPGAVKESVEDLAAALLDEGSELSKDVNDLYSTLAITDSATAGTLKEINEQLRNARDSILVALNPTAPEPDTTDVSESVNSKSFWTNRVKKKNTGE